jgi:exodeoxyribonuclease-5
LTEGLSEFISSNEIKEVVLIKGFAGTGKTTVISSLYQTLVSLGIQPVLMAPTGRAAKVMAGYTGMPAYTIHKIIYRQKSSSDGTGSFVIDKNFYRNTFFIVDEASMISNQNSENSVFGSGRLLDDMLEFVFSGVNCRLILTGDTAQLPPVGISVSPALDPYTLKKYGLKIKEFILTDVVRQAEGSGILSCATLVRKQIEDSGNSGFFNMQIGSFSDVERISGMDLTEYLTSCYDKYGLFETAVVTRSNKRANLFNKGIRSSILYREEEIERGDILMVVKNNYYWNSDTPGLDFIANGDIAEVVSIKSYEELYGFRFANVRLRFIDYDDVEIVGKIFLDTLYSETASMSAGQNKKLFDAVAGDYTEYKNKRHRWDKIRQNPYFNALQVKFAYALTCHKAQGGQWKAVFVDHGYLVEEMLDHEYYRWLYTAFTRSVERLFLVNFNSGFFESPA